MNSQALRSGLLLLLLYGTAWQAAAVAEVAEPGTVELDGSCKNVLELGDSRLYWRALRKARASREPDLIRQMQAEIGAVPTDLALAHLLNAYSGRFGEEDACGRGWSRAEDLVGIAERAVRVDTPALLLSEPTLRGEHLSVLAVAQPSSYFPIVATKQQGVGGLHDWADARPMDAGVWAQVETATGATGWLYVDGGGMTAFKLTTPALAPFWNMGGQGAGVGSVVIVSVGLLGLLSLLLRRRGDPAPDLRSSSGGYQTFSSSSSTSHSGGPSKHEAGAPPLQAHFVKRQAAPPKPGWFESAGSYRTRVGVEASERLIEDFRGTAPVQSWIEDEADYRRRIRTEVDEAIVETARGGAARQSWFEGDDDYSARVSQEADEAIVEGLTGTAPSPAWFESEETYSSRLSHEANEAIVESATGSAPSPAWFETEEDYEARLAEEADEVRASRKD